MSLLDGRGRVTALWLAVLQGLDLVSTYVALSVGGVEGNQAMRWAVGERWPAVLMKVAFAVFALVNLPRMWHVLTVRCVSTLVAAAYLVVVLWNTSVALRLA